MKMEQKPSKNPKKAPKSAKVHKNRAKMQLKNN